MGPNNGNNGSAMTRREIQLPKRRASPSQMWARGPLFQAKCMHAILIARPKIVPWRVRPANASIDRSRLIAACIISCTPGGTRPPCALWVPFPMPAAFLCSCRSAVVAGGAPRLASHSEIHPHTPTAAPAIMRFGSPSMDKAGDGEKKKRAVDGMEQWIEMIDRCIDLPAPLHGA